MGERNTLLLELAERHTNVKTLHDMAEVREPVWTWLSNHVDSFQGVGSTEAALGDVWAHLRQTHWDKCLL